MRKTTTRQQERINKDRELNHHISSLLVDLIPKAKNLIYSGYISDFSKNYTSKKFTDIKEEANMIKETFCAILNEIFGHSFEDEFQNTMSAEQAAMVIDVAYRDHFIHPFQVFLLGAIILDYFHENFESWYSKTLSKIPKSSIDTAWLLAALFHDRMRPVEKIRGLVQYEEDIPTTGYLEEKQYIANISSLYEHLMTGNRLDDWTYKKSRQPSSEMCCILQDFSKRRNHGVTSALSFFRHIIRAFERRPTNIETAAALAIALHNGEPRKALLKIHIFPIDIKVPNQLPTTLLRYNRRMGKNQRLGLRNGYKTCRSQHQRQRSSLRSIIRQHILCEEEIGRMS